MDKSIFNKYIKENTFTLPNKLRDNCLRTQWIYIRFLQNTIDHGVVLKLRVILASW